MEFLSKPLSIVDEIPYFVEPESYADAFGLQWQKWANTQLDSHTGLDITRSRTKRMFGEHFYNLAGKLILEAGSGAGRFTEVLLEREAKLSSFDLSEAVHVNKSNNEHSNLQLFRCSITEIPFNVNSFDYVFCPGVIQHTPNPRESVESLWKQVKPGGYLIFDQYRFNLSHWLRPTWIIRIVAKRLSPKNGIRFTNFLVRVFLPLHKKLAFRGFFEILLFRISPITTHFTAYPNMKHEDQIAWAELNTHDNLTDWYKHFTNLKKLRKILVGLGASEVRFSIMPYTIEVIAKKPESSLSEPYSEEVLLMSKRGVNTA
jgi:2-polyprenyl-3-methyl-5-hydroxy-6-metoxy-1,4-benzoquinol methylase